VEHGPRLVARAPRAREQARQGPTQAATVAREAQKAADDNAGKPPPEQGAVT